MLLIMFARDNLPDNEESGESAPDPYSLYAVGSGIYVNP
jgi:hypothetical protein